MAKVFVIRAYCSKCNKLLMESNPMTKKEVKASWDKAVLDAPAIVCKDCDTKVPNFNLNLKIYNRASKLERDSKDFLPKPKLKL